MKIGRRIYSWHSIAPRRLCRVLTRVYLELIADWLQKYLRRYSAKSKDISVLTVKARPARFFPATHLPAFPTIARA